MRAKLLLNDVHLGVIRTAGTTPATAVVIREYLLQNLREIMFEHVHYDIIVNGDLFDTFNVPMIDALEFYYLACEWLKVPGNLGRLVLGRGNHDWSKDSAKLSSFDFVSRILVAQFNRVQVVTEPTFIDEGIYMIPHLANQDIFNLALDNVPTEAKMVLLHANWANEFRGQRDHSLSVPEETARKLVDAGKVLVFGHEHQAKRYMEDRVIITGNQWPSSVADCLDNPENLKHAHVIDSDLSITKINTWSGWVEYADVAWDALGETAIVPGVKFVRISGQATSEQAGEVVKAIAAYRKTSDAFVVTNAVKVDGVTDMEALPQSMEEIKGFDVLGYLYENLEEPQVAAVKALLAEAAP